MLQRLLASTCLAGLIAIAPAVADQSSNSAMCVSQSQVDHDYRTSMAMLDFMPPVCEPVAAAQSTPNIAAGKVDIMSEMSDILDEYFQFKLDRVAGHPDTIATRPTSHIDVADFDWRTLESEAVGFANYEGPKNKTAPAAIDQLDVYGPMPAVDPAEMSKNRFGDRPSPDTAG